MKFKFFIFIILIAVILGIAVYGYLSATPGVKGPTIKYPKIEITPLTFDFGEIKFGEIAQAIFKVKNTGEEILEIQRVATSCACTTAQVNKEKINPSEEAELLVKYDTTAMGNSAHGKGKQERIIYLKSNDPLSPQAEVMIYADVY